MHTKFPPCGLPTLLAGALAVCAVATGCADAEPDADVLSAQALVAQPAPPRPKIRSVRLSGSGCRDAGEVFLTGDRGSFFADFSDYLVTVSPAQQEAEAECTLSIALDGAEGWAYAPAGMDVELNTDANSNVLLTTGGQWTTPRSSKTSRQTRISTRGRPTLGSVLDEPGLWSSCSGTRELEVTTRLSVRGQQGRSGYASIYSLADLQFRARSCEAADAPDGGAGDAPVVHSVTLSGRGCSDPADATATLSPDRTSFAVDFRALASRTAQSGQCNARVELRNARGYRASLASLELQGTAQLLAGASGKVGVSWWRGSELLEFGPDRHQSATHDGPRDGRYQSKLTFAQDASRGACGADRLDLMVDALAYGGAADGSRITIDRLHAVQLRFERCE